MNTLAPELSALIIILGSAGPVISTRRSSRSAGAGATVHSASRTSLRREEEVRHDARVEVRLALVAPLQEIEPCRPEPPLEVGHERQRVRGQDPVGAGNVDRVGVRCHPCQPSPRRTVASISPCGSVVGV